MSRDLNVFTRIEKNQIRKCDSRKALVVPKSAILEHKPASWLAEPAPPFALRALLAYEARSIEIAWEAKSLRSVGGQGMRIIGCPVSIGEIGCM